MSITIIVGKPGVGKTLLETNFLCEKMLNSQDDLYNLKREIKQLKAGGFSYLDMPQQKHVCYADYNVKLSKRFQAYYIDGFQIGLPNPYFKTTFIPPYSTIFLDEAQRYYDSRNTKSLRPEVYNWFQLHRQNHYNIYLVCQRLGNLDLNIRSIADNIIVIDDLKIKYNKLKYPTIFEWITRQFESSDTAEDYCLKSEQNGFADIGKKIKIISKLPLFSVYNSYNNQPIFFNGNENRPFDYVQESKYKMCVSSFVEFNENHLFTAPTGYWKSATEDKKIKKGEKNGN